MLGHEWLPDEEVEELYKVPGDKGGLEGCVRASVSGFLLVTPASHKLGAGFQEVGCRVGDVVSVVQQLDLVDEQLALFKRVSFKVFPKSALLE